MKAEDINFTDNDNSEDEMMILIQQNINLEQAVDMMNELIRTLDEQVQNLEEITHLHEMKEFALKLYIKSLENELEMGDEEE